MNKDLRKFIEKLSLNDNKTLSQKCGKVTEENGELSKSILTFENASGFQDKIIKKRNILEESVDVILSAISIPLSEGYSYDDIFDLMYQKSLTWESKQVKEKNVEFPIWYEIHVTVERPSNIDDYVDFCKSIGVKPIVLDLQNGGKSVMKDVMTSSKHLGDNNSIMFELERISLELKNEGYNVIREKIESVPYHPLAPRRYDYNSKMPENCYFESHIGILINEKDYNKKELEYIAKTTNSHLSRNFFKKNENGFYTIMLTYRNYEGTLEDFNEEVENIKSILDNNDFTYEKVITEFSIYDTKISHDNIWLKNS